MAISLQGDVYPGFLNDWQSIMEPQTGVWGFNQVAGPGAPLTRNCGVYIQPDREQIGRAMSAAYVKLSRYLGAPAYPMWMTERITLGRGVPWWRQQLRTKYGRVIQFGKQAQTLIEADAVVTYSDADGDGVNDTATVSVVTGVDASEIALFFRVADGAYSTGNTRFQIAPVRVSVSAGTATLVAHRALFVKPTIWQTPYDPADANDLERNAASTSSVADFVTAVDVYRVYTDTSQAIQIISDTLDVGVCAPCSSAATDGCVRVWDYEQGIFEPRVDADFCGRIAPQFVIVNYLADVPVNADGGMDIPLQQALMRRCCWYRPRDRGG